MLIYKIVRFEEVEGLTRMGWKLLMDRTYNETRIEMRSQGWPMTNPPYQGAMQYIDQAVPVMHTLFTLSKDEGQETLEATLKHRLSVADNDIEKLNQDLLSAQNAGREANQNFERERALTRDTDKRFAEVADRSYKLERDLAKVRKAIGDIEFNKIVQEGSK